jgi:cytochrome c-type biogenesis protein CcmI
VNGADIVPTILGIALVAAAAAFALLPFTRGSTTQSVVASAEPRPTDRSVLYRQVLELEFDVQLGKLAAEDYEQLSRELLAEAGQALHEERGGIGELDEEIEREIAAARAAFAAARRSGDREKKPNPAGTPS